MVGGKASKGTNVSWIPLQVLLEHSMHKRGHLRYFGM